MFVSKAVPREMFLLCGLFQGNEMFQSSKGLLVSRISCDVSITRYAAVLGRG